MNTGTVDRWLLEIFLSSLLLGITVLPKLDFPIRQHKSHKIQLFYFCVEYRDLIHLTSNKEMIYKNYFCVWNSNLLGTNIYFWIG